MEPLGESNTERRVKLSTGVSKEGTQQYIYYQITKFEDEGGGVKMYGVLIQLMNQNFSKGKIFHESSKLKHFQWGLKI